MRINRGESKPQIQFGSIVPGTVFEYGVTTYVKTLPLNGYNAFDISNGGGFVAFVGTDKIDVYPNAILHLNEKTVPNSNS